MDKLDSDLIENLVFYGLWLAAVIAALYFL